VGNDTNKPCAGFDARSAIVGDIDGFLVLRQVDGPMVASGPNR